MYNRTKTESYEMSEITYNRNGDYYSTATN